MTNASFTSNSITINGSTFPTEYNITATGKVFAFVELPEGDELKKMRIRFDPIDEHYAEALAAAQTHRNHCTCVQVPAAPDWKPEVSSGLVADAPHTRLLQAQRAEREPAPTMISTLVDDLAICFRPIEPTADEPAADPVDAEPNAADEPITEADAAEPAPEANAAAPVEPVKAPAQKKLFVGLEITGKGWKIVADGAYDRTRVIFKKMPSAAAREAVKAAGFFWSPTMKSWNKKLTHKAWRAAQELAMQLRTIAV